MQGEISVGVPAPAWHTRDSSPVCVLCMCYVCVHLCVVTFILYSL